MKIIFIMFCENSWQYLDIKIIHNLNATSITRSVVNFCLTLFINLSRWATLSETLPLCISFSFSFFFWLTLLVLYLTFAWCNFYFFFVIYYFILTVLISLLLKTYNKLSRVSHRLQDNSTARHDRFLNNQV